VRISSLRQGTTGRFLQGGHPLDFGRLLAANVVFQIEDTGDDRDKAFLMGTVLIHLVEHLRLRQRAEGASAPRLRHLSVFEEAHRLLRQQQGHAGGAAAHAVEMFAGLLAKIRAYGEGLIIAEQIPSKLIPDVIKNTAVKIVHRLPAADDRQAVGATVNLTEEQSAYLVTLTPGEAAVFADGMDYPAANRMPDDTRRETTNPPWPHPPARSSSLAGSGAVPDGDGGYSGSYCPVAALNLTTSSAGTRPRSFTSMPWALAHSRTSVVFSPLGAGRRPVRAGRRAAPLARRAALT
jgi:hypothetical protein